MNNQSKNNDPWSNRYTMELSVNKFLDRITVEFDLYKSDQDVVEIDKLIDAAGYSKNYQGYTELVSQVKRTFTIEEIGEFLKCLSSLDVVEVIVQHAILHGSELRPREKNTMVVPMRISHESFSFSTLEGYELPFEIVGLYKSR